MEEIFMEWINEPNKQNSKRKESCKECKLRCVIKVCSSKYPVACKTKIYPTSR